MVSKELLKKIKKLELKTRRLISGDFLGNIASVKRGFGLEFDQLTDYQFGDDIRFIDWKASARSQKILVRRYKEERNKTIILMVDLSASISYSSGSGSIEKSEMIKQIAGMLAFISLYQKDSVGLVLFTDKIELFIKPGSSSAHVYKLVMQIFSYKPKSSKTDMSKVFNEFCGMQKKRALLCVVSDLLDSVDQRVFSKCMYLHELLIFKCLDIAENIFPAAGLLNIENIETNKIETFNTGQFGAKFTVSHWSEKQDQMFKTMGIKSQTFFTNDDISKKFSIFLESYYKY